MSINTKDEKYLKIFGDHVKRLRLSNNFTIERLAITANVSYSQISRIEAGQINPTICTIQVIAKAMKVHPMEFFNFEYEGTLENMIKKNLSKVGGDKKFY